MPTSDSQVGGSNGRRRVRAGPPGGAGRSGAKEQEGGHWLVVRRRDVWRRLRRAHCTGLAGGGAPQDAVAVGGEPLVRVHEAPLRVRVVSQERQACKVCQRFVWIKSSASGSACGSKARLVRIPSRNQCSAMI